jgi:hypothetical protein
MRGYMLDYVSHLLARFICDITRVLLTEFNHVPKLCAHHVNLFRLRAFARALGQSTKTKLKPRLRSMLPCHDAMVTPRPRVDVILTSVLTVGGEHRGHEVHIYTRAGVHGSSYEVIDGVHVHRVPIDLDVS